MMLTLKLHAHLVAPLCEKVFVLTTSFYVAGGRKQHKSPSFFISDGSGMDTLEAQNLRAFGSSWRVEQPRIVVLKGTGGPLFAISGKIP